MGPANCGTLHRSVDRNSTVLWQAMLFNSFAFVAFFVVVYGAYVLALRRHRAQNALLLGASYVFYGAWDWRFLGLIWLSTVADYVIAIRLDGTSRQDARKRLLIASVLINLTVLGFFKYFNFFAENFASLVSLFGLEAGDITLRFLLPVGISFYTFQTMAYTIDVYRQRMPAERNLMDYALFVAFFPQLVAGPIERAVRLMPQIKSPRVITSDSINVGLFLIVWGYFKKVVVADQLAKVADRAFGASDEIGAATMVAGAIAFTFQIYCDFSGYTDIARGVARLLGFELMVNFRLPYLAKTPSDFWSRWHISLSTWIRDYLYISLGGNRSTEFATYRNLMIAMVLAGMWHGAEWTFIIWGVYHGLLLVSNRMLSAHGKLTWLGVPSSGGRGAVQVALMFSATVFGWIIFRSDSIADLTSSILALGRLGDGFPDFGASRLVFFIAPVLAMQYFQARSGDLLVALRLNTFFYGLLLGGLVLSIVVFGNQDSAAFIYFQF